MPLVKDAKAREPSPQTMRSGAMRKFYKILKLKHEREI